MRERGDAQLTGGANRSAGEGSAAPARAGAWNGPRGPDRERGAREKVGPETAQPGGEDFPFFSFSIFNSYFYFYFFYLLFF
jgi:hypothetical protein